jgi:hypothetical protein
MYPIRDRASNVAFLDHSVVGSVRSRGRPLTELQTRNQKLSGKCPKTAKSGKTRPNQAESEVQKQEPRKKLETDNLNPAKSR